MSQVDTLGTAAGKVINVGRGTQFPAERLWRGVLALNQVWQRLFSALGALFRQITSDPRPNSAHHLGTYVPFLDSTQPPIHRHD